MYDFVYKIEEFNIKDFRGSINIDVQVIGFRSTSPISIWLRVDNTNELSIAIRHSSGGRSQEQEPDGIKAAENFGTAMIACAKYARELRSKENELIDAYNKHKESERKKYEEIRRVKQEKIDADTIIGEESARNILNVLKAKAKENSTGSVNLGFRHRGSDKLFKITCTYTGTRAQFKNYSSGNRISYNDVLRIIKQCAEVKQLEQYKN